MIRTKNQQLIRTLSQGCGVIIMTEDEFNAIQNPILNNYVTIDVFNNYVINNDLTNIVEIIDDIGPGDGLVPVTP